MSFDPRIASNLLHVSRQQLIQAFRMCLEVSVVEPHCNENSQREFAHFRLRVGIFSVIGCRVTINQPQPTAEMPQLFLEC